MKRILHIDMNSFFVSCELREYDNPFEKKLVIGGDSKKRQGVVAAASYEARKFGIHAAMSVNEALKLAPDLIISSHNFDLYVQISNELFKYIKSKFKIVEQASIDEAYIDITDEININGNEMNLAKKLQKNILNKFNLPCSIGIGSNRLQAKMASNKNKPQKITIINNNFNEVFGEDDISTIHGLGKSSQVKYRKFGIIP